MQGDTTGVHGIFQALELVLVRLGLSSRQARYPLLLIKWQICLMLANGMLVLFIVFANSMWLPFHRCINRRKVVL